MPGSLRVSATVEIPEAELRWRFSRSSGPGGQGVNTTDSRAELSWDAARTSALDARQRERVLARLGPRLADGVLTLVASEHRSQLRNREAAEARLVALLRDALRPPARTRRATRPSRAAVERRLAQKRRRSEVKRDRRAP